MKNLEKKQKETNEMRQTTIEKAFCSLKNLFKASLAQKGRLSITLH